MRRMRLGFPDIILESQSTLPHIRLEQAGSKGISHWIVPGKEPITRLRWNLSVFEDLFETWKAAELALRVKEEEILPVEVAQHEKLKFRTQR